MKIFKVILFALMLTTSSSYAGELYQKFGVFDYKHDTDAFALTTKYTQDKNINIRFFGDLKPIYEISFFYDNHNGTSSSQGLSTYLSSGLTKEINLGKKIFFAPSFSAGLYQEYDDAKDMGHILEFKSEIELNYNIFKNSVIGISWSHISNADLSTTNPGSDNLLFNLKIKENF